jgi:tRNA-specific 2-thiouridylase
VQIRHHAAASPGQIIAGEGRRAVVELDQPAFGVAPGQAAVFFRGEEVLGGGWIAG